MSLVLDSSATLAWLYADEMTVAIQDVFRRVSSTRAWVPAIWRLEVANALSVGIRRGRITAAFRDASLSDLGLLDIVTDPETDAMAWTEIVRVSDRFGLTLYDAAYLELAKRRNLPLATLDRELRVAAQSFGVPLLGVSD